MTKEQIKATVTVPELLSRYGVEVRHGRCRGFCHSGRDFNMSVKNDSCYCFVCGKAFDVFNIVAFFENCDFKKAFEILGGAKPASNIARYKAKQYSQQQNKRNRLAERYDRLFELWCAMDYAIILYNQTDNPSKELECLYVYALHNINRIAAELEEVDMRELR